MDVYIIIGFLLVGVLLAVLCLLLYQVLARQNQLAVRMQNQEKLTAQSSAAAASAAHARFEAVQNQIQALNKEQTQNGSVIDRMANRMESINQIMTNTKMRGSWGEYQMEHLIRAYAGDSSAVYEVQYRLDNGRIADGAFHLPGSDQVLCIDSKFPMENFLRMSEQPEQKEFYEKELVRNIKKHINDVAEKYITPRTAPQALLFIPSEAIYQFICGPKEELLPYALQKHVLLVSPTTLAGVTYTLIAASKDYYQAKNLAGIMQELDALQDEFEALEEKMDKAERALSSAVNAHQSLHKALDANVRHISSILEGEGKEVGSDVFEKSRFEYPEKQSASLSGSQRFSGGA